MAHKCQSLTQFIGGKNKDGSWKHLRCTRTGRIEFMGKRYCQVHYRIELEKACRKSCKLFSNATGKGKEK